MSFKGKNRKKQEIKEIKKIRKNHIFPQKSPIWYSRSKAGSFGLVPRSPCFRHRRYSRYFFIKNRISHVFYCNFFRTASPSFSPIFSSEFFRFFMKFPSFFTSSNIKSTFGKGELKILLPESFVFEVFCLEFELFLLRLMMKLAFSKQLSSRERRYFNAINAAEFFESDFDFPSPRLTILLSRKTVVK